MHSLPVHAVLQAFLWYNRQVTALIKPPFSVVEAALEDSQQATPAPGPRTAPPQASGDSSEAPCEPDGKVGRTTTERHLPLVLRTYRAHQDPLASILPERLPRRIKPASRRDPAHALRDVRRSVR